MMDHTYARKWKCLGRCKTEKVTQGTQTEPVPDDDYYEMQEIERQYVAHLVSSVRFEQISCPNETEDFLQAVDELRRAMAGEQPRPVLQEHQLVERDVNALRVLAAQEYYSDSEDEVLEQQLQRCARRRQLQQEIVREPPVQNLDEFQLPVLDLAERQNVQQVSNESKRPRLALVVVNEQPPQELFQVQPEPPREIIEEHESEQQSSKDKKMEH